MAPAGNMREMAVAMEKQPVAGRDLASEEGAADGGDEPLLEAQPATFGRALGARALLLAVVAALALMYFSARCLVGSGGSVTSSGQLAGGAVLPAESSPSLDLDSAVELVSSRRRRRRRRRRRTAGSTAAGTLTTLSNRRRDWKSKWGEENKNLKECMGDCKWKLLISGSDYYSIDECPGELKCLRHGTPPGCKGKADKDTGYCIKDSNAVLMIVTSKRARSDFELALSHHKTPRTVDMTAASGKYLSYHLKKVFEKGQPQYEYLNQGKAGKYKHVILQEHPVITRAFGNRRRSAADKQWEDSTTDLDALDNLVQKQGGRTVIFQDWGDRDSFDDEMPLCRKSAESWLETLTRRDAGGRVTYSPLIAPMGDAYANIKAWSNDEFMGLFEADDTWHETEAARYLGAMVLYQTVTGDSCVGLPGPVDTEFSAAKTKKYQEAAHEACTNVKKIPMDR